MCNLIDAKEKAALLPGSGLTQQKGDTMINKFITNPVIEVKFDENYQVRPPRGTWIEPEEPCWIVTLHGEPPVPWIMFQAWLDPEFDDDDELDVPYNVLDMCVPEKWPMAIEFRDKSIEVAYLCREIEKLQAVSVTKELYSSVVQQLRKANIDKVAYCSKHKQ